jgi:hypothetical protein
VSDPRLSHAVNRLYKRVKSVFGELFKYSQGPSWLSLYDDQTRYFGQLEKLLRDDYRRLSHIGRVIELTRLIDCNLDFLSDGNFERLAREPLNGKLKFDVYVEEFKAIFKRAVEAFLSDPFIEKIFKANSARKYESYEDVSRFVRSRTLQMVPLVVSRSFLLSDSDDVLKAAAAVAPLNEMIDKASRCAIDENNNHIDMDLFNNAAEKAYSEADDDDVQVVDDNCTSSSSTNRNFTRGRLSVSPEKKAKPKSEVRTRRRSRSVSRRRSRSRSRSTRKRKKSRSRSRSSGRERRARQTSVSGRRSKRSRKSRSRSRKAHKRRRSSSRSTSRSRSSRRTRRGSRSRETKSKSHLSVKSCSSVKSSSSAKSSASRDSGTSTSSKADTAKPSNAKKSRSSMRKYFLVKNSSLEARKKEA